MSNGTEEGPGKPGSALDAVRQALGQHEPRDTAGARALELRSGWDLVNLSDADFETRLGYITKRQERMTRIIGTVIREGKHFGNPQIRIKGALQWVDREKTVPRLAFDKPILKQAGASELRNFFRYDCRPFQEPVIVVDKKFCMVTVIVAIYDQYQNLLGTAVGACTSAEKRFRYDDARELVNNVYKQAFKRAAVQVTAQVTGADAFFGMEEEVSNAVAAGKNAGAPDAGGKLNEEDERVLASACRARGMTTRGELRALLETYGMGSVVGTKNLEKVLDLVAGWPQNRAGANDIVTPVKSPRDPYEPPLPEPEEPAGTPSGALDFDRDPEEPGDAADDDDLPL